MKPGHARSCERSRTCRDHQPQSLKYSAAVAVLAAECEPQNAAGEGSVDDRRQLLRADPDDCPGGLAVSEDAARAGRAEAVLHVGRAAEALGGPSGEVLGKRKFESAKVAATSSIPRGGCAQIRIGNQGEELGLALPEAAGLKAERVAAGLQRDYSPHQVAFSGPKVEKAAAVVGRNGAAGQPEVEKEVPVFEDHRTRVIGQEGFEGTAQRGRTGSLGSRRGRHPAAIFGPGMPAGKRKTTSAYAFVIR